MTSTRTHRGIRTNNPGNLRYVGQPLKGLATPPSDSHGMCVFKDMPHGLRGLALDLIAKFSRHHLTNVWDIISRYAPPPENDTGSYVLDVCQRLGVNADDEINLLDTAVLRKMMQAIVRHECGTKPDKSEWLDAAAFDEGIALAGFKV